MGHAETPQIPEVTDEAGDSPKWLPLLGAGLFALAVGLILWAHVGGESAGSDSAAEAAPAE
jgi:hypothetical protein